MPPKGTHVDQARHNRQFWSSFDLGATPFRDWIVTGIFYEALQWIEAYLATQDEHSTTHGHRTTAITRYDKLDSIAVAYDVLKIESENARYNAHLHTDGEIQRDLVPLVDSIEAHVALLL